MANKELPMVIWRDEDGVFIATCPIIPGCHSQGSTQDEAASNLREAIDLCLEGQAEEGWQLPSEWELRSA